MTSAQPTAVTPSAPAGPRRWLVRALRFPLVRIVLAVIVVSVAMNATRAILKFAGLVPERGTPHRLALLLLGTVVTIAVVHVAYLAHVRYMEGRSATELAASGAARELALGAILGAAIFSAAIAVLYAAGWYGVAGTNPWTTAFGPLLAAAGAAYVEELIVRGILFRNVEEMLGSWLALVITAAIFGLAHLSNPNATLTGAVAIALEAGVLLGAAYMATQRLWLAIGIHFAWNFVQGGIFGVAVSGVASNGILRGELHGPVLLTGGSFGVEGSLVAVVVCLAAAVPLLAIARRRGNVVPPMWRRPLTTADVPQLRATAAFNSASISGGGENP
ncbi:MAG TPA: type II CAAX endopeptidase family protein [Gemmatimonadaceae bacterium]|nr:type II CAAX endopeptidase family protein [Gemmatimonadaceae bacterium]